MSFFCSFYDHLLGICQHGMVLILGRCQDGFVLVPREMSRLFGFGSSGDVMMVWFWFLGRCHDGLASGNSGDVEVA